MNIKYTSLLSLVFLFSVIYAQAQTAAEVCDGVLKYASRNIYAQATQRDRRSFLYSEACGGKYRTASQNDRFGLDVIAQGVILGFDGDFNKKSTKVDEWCNKNTISETDLDIAEVFRNTVYKPSIDAWDSCIRANTEKIRFEPILSISNPVFNVKNITDPGVNIQIRNVSISNSSTTCRIFSKGKPPITINSNTSDFPLIEIPAGGGTASIDCRRNTETRTISGKQIEITPQVEISILTSLSNYKVTLPTNNAVLVSEDKMNEILNRLSKLENQISASEGCMRINKTQICWGEASVIPLNPGWDLAEFVITFNQPFAAPPIVTNGLNTNDITGGNRKTTLVKSSITNAVYTGTLSNTGGFEIPRGKFQYIAVGLAKD